MCCREHGPYKCQGTSPTWQDGTDGKSEAAQNRGTVHMKPGKGLHAGWPEYLMSCVCVCTRVHVICIHACISMLL